MRWTRRRIVWLLGLALGSVALASAALLLALRHEPTSYAEACAVDPREAGERCDEVLQQAALMASSETMHRPWTLQLSERQVNAWLAIDVPKNHPYLLSEELSEPRVTFDEGGLIRVAARYHGWGLTTVLELVLEFELLEPNLLAVRFVRARAGALPLPLAEALDVLSQVARSLDLRVTWRESDGAPVALLGLPGPAPGGTALALESLSVDGEGFMAAGRFAHAAELPLAQRAKASRER